MTLKDDLQRTTERIKKSGRKGLYLLLIGLLLASLAMTVLSLDIFQEYSALTIGITKSFIGIMMLLFIDDIIFRDIDTENEIKNKNLSYAILYLANAIIIAACIALS